ncbi:hypothetical protein [Edaphobacter modestus]|uniref:Uncharacterized protein n=1 Tax=Edaphobacter modestus TaxID=388466 RepID=A0A4V2G4D8_9BACT|nr:hypothetical protein [Edaphobacter modestus]RZU40596.1 hypothetical protein BDD14_2065 [Edaphobacter modestus]
MKRTPDVQKKAIAIGGFVALAAGILYYQLSDDSPAPRAQQPVAVQTSRPAASRSSAGVAREVGTASTQLDPTLKMGPMLVAEQLVYSGTGRNIFSASSAPIDIPKPVASARPKVSAPVYTPPPGPPPPPPIDLKFFGTETTSKGKRLAFLLHGEDVFLAQDGEVVQRRYRILTVSANSVLVEDMTNNNRQSLPLIVH